MNERPDTLECRRLAELEDVRRLRPIIDPDLDVVLVDCPECDAGAGDPLGMWRPARIVSRAVTRTQTIICDACGRVSERRL